MYARTDPVSSESRTPSHDRRHSGRPFNGDRRTCPSCGNIARFEERYAIARRGVTLSEPAWVCRRCGAETFVRHAEGNGHTATRRPGSKARSVTMVARGDVRELRRVLADIRFRAHSDRESTDRPRKRTHSSLDDVAGAQFVSVMAADDRGRIVEANAAACALSGFTRAELVKMRVSDLFPEHPERFSRAWRRFVATGAFAGACRLRQRSGLLVTVECVASANVIAGVHVATLASRRLLQSLS